ncbi:serine hydrolase domain-containing protein [Luteibacter yeojuensis]
MAKKALVATGILIALGATGWAVFRPDQALRVAAGVAAHHVCSMTFVGGQDPRRTYDELVTPMIGETAARLLTPHVSHVPAGVEVSGPFRSLARAEFVPGYGCRLVLPGNRPLAADTTSHAAMVADGLAPSDAVVAATQPAIAAAVDRVFHDEPGKPPKRVKAVVVVKDGHVIAERYAPGVGVHTPLISFSVAKSFTNAFLGTLARKGALRVDQPLGAPEWKAPGDARAAITLEDLLRMRSGLAIEEAESAFSPVARMEFLHADMAGFAAAQPAKEPPGKSFEYTSGNTVLLDRLLGEKVGGGPAGLRAFARRELFDPLGMGDVTMEFDGQGTFVGSTYVYASARDYARFGMLYLRDGVAPDGTRLLPEGWIGWSRTSTLGAPYGAGFWTNDGPSDLARRRVAGGFPKDGFFASGTMGQRIYIVPSERLVVVRLGYSAPPDYGIVDDMGLIEAAIAASR